MSSLKDKNKNQITDFGVKRLFGPDTAKIFEQLFEATEIAKFSPEERNAYEERLKFYRDLKNMIDTAREEGREEGRNECSGDKDIEIAREMKMNGEPLKKIMQYTNLSKAEIEKL